ncbi:alpha/beta hydrolase family protein [Microbacterium allomyrinae]|uniref:Alpha/beta fold hydrolase n=1 Tax=Microbacterium allomyrinae TaxID=2830666 RepID=A0A9X1S5A8_9MICO|nr:alpha/beta fold hydrolase [Microbacterium allomyrinae]MCC2034033.1 alpha/beta fold hydrolase [Microbacterium allomyrinae]
MFRATSRTRIAPRWVALPLIGIVIALSACSAAPAAPIATPAPTTPATPTLVGPQTLSTLIDLPPESPQLEYLDEVESVAGETATQVAYSSGGSRVTGVLRVPAGEGPFPAVVVVHGSTDPETYETGGDLIPEQRGLLDAGFAVFALDLRGYADSAPADTAALGIDPGFGWVTTLDWAMALDVANGLQALRTGDVPTVDADRVGLLGHSLGGLLVLDAAVIAPGASDLVVALSAAPSDLGAALDEIREARPDLAEEFDFSGTPAADPGYWAEVSPRGYFDRVTEPLLMIHGSADDTTDPQWSRDTVEAWAATGNRAEFFAIEGGDHHFRPARADEVAMTVAAFEAVLG